MKPTALNGIIAAVLTATALTACSKPTPIPWKADTEFRFAGLMATEAPHVERVFQAHNIAFQRTSESPITYKVTGINTVRELAYIHRDLRAVSRNNRISMPLERATLNFGGLAASGSVLTRVTIQITPEAHALVADRPVGAPWRLVAVDARGKWEGLVNTKGLVAKNGGWVYIAAIREDINRYYRVNVLTSQQQHVSFTDLRAAGLSEPTPADLATQPSHSQGANSTATTDEKPTDTKSAGFKWPWQK